MSPEYMARWQAEFDAYVAALSPEDRARFDEGMASLQRVVDNFAEPADGEYFIPRAADPDRSRRILEQAADWYGGAFKVNPPPDPDQP